MTAETCDNAVGGVGCQFTSATVFTAPSDIDRVRVTTPRDSVGFDVPIRTFEPEKETTYLSVTEAIV
ncbi:hypothetical protein [Haladaptatus caseinilyticus]|uniref:hypothetical protein n=1 Tax=Haladaptatus caseinilyticus TaxID=2993314 RepID=UPI00224B4F06|nr:hypothetical protein [Haladaptatus caseinilyticus]